MSNRAFISYGRRAIFAFFGSRAILLYRVRHRVESSFAMVCLYVVTQDQDSARQRSMSIRANGPIREPNRNGNGYVYEFRASLKGNRNQFVRPSPVAYGPIVKYFVFLVMCVCRRYVGDGFRHRVTAYQEDAVSCRFNGRYVRVNGLAFCYALNVRDG